MENVLTARFIKRFRSGVEIHADFSMASDRHSMMVLYGPSGCGKTTILRCLAGLDQPSGGVIGIDGEAWYDDAARLSRSPQERRCGFVFQDYALFPHLNVGENIGFGLSGISKAGRRMMVDEMIERLELKGLGRRSLGEISAGQKQRVALGRALILRPKLLLLDEPFAALDTLLRQELRQSIKSMLEVSGIPCVFVTHDPEEARLLGDSIVVMRNGLVLQQGPVCEVFTSPDNDEVSRLLGRHS